MTEDIPFEIDCFRPKDADGVVALYRAVYGDHYPVKSIYDAREILRQEETRETLRMVARNPEGEVIGHIAVYRSILTVPNRNLYEIGQLMIRPDYRKKGVGSQLDHTFAREIIQNHTLDIWGEAVTSHLVSQQMAEQNDYIETGLEMDIIPKSDKPLPTCLSVGGRVSAVLFFKITTERPQTLYIPCVYEDLFRFLYEEIGHGSTLAISGGELPGGTRTGGSMDVLQNVGIARITVTGVGSDFSGWIQERESEAAGAAPVITQVILPLTMPCVGTAVGILRAKGYFIGGALPRWFGDDGILMQHHAGIPNFEGVSVYTKRAQEIKERVYDDWKTVTGMR
ncbi:MAG: GNAT family N-acetyltransferase [Methanoregula sp.]|uniref:GNAT family N-acetyltransferase n=1 Tax=Methanoregula sp. TaxID=2052170 RepID=UPI0025D14AE2|nr:GNAT family N-acetyltransferase [Methanoregula sp.]MCK9630235.1 GNAT family N-acetyltransferase [Methanoregula sp.]